MTTVVLRGLVYLSLAIYLGSFMGIIGVVFAMILSQPISLILEPTQVYKLVGRKAEGIWNV